MCGLDCGMAAVERATKQLRGGVHNERLGNAFLKGKKNLRVNSD